MKLLALIFAILAPLAVRAQQPPPAQDPEKSAIGSMLVEAMQREAAARSQVFSLQQQLEAAKAQAAKPAEAPK